MKRKSIRYRAIEEQRDAIAEEMRRTQHGIEMAQSRLEGMGQALGKLNSELMAMDVGIPSPAKNRAP